MTSAAVFQRVDVAALAGPLFLGCIFNVLLLGMSGIQAYLHYLAFPKDTRVVKAIVALLLIVETVQTILVVFDCFHLFVIYMSTLERVGPSWTAVPMTSGLVGCAVQAFFVYRIWILSRSRIVCASILLISLSGFTAAILTGAIAAGFHQPELILGGRNSDLVPLTIWLVCSALCDLAIAVAMTISLQNKRSALQETNRIASRIIWMSIETGSVTAAVATVGAILVLALPKSISYTLPSLLLSKVHSNTYMAILNSRIKILGSRYDMRRQQSATSPHVIHLEPVTKTSAPDVRTHWASQTGVAPLDVTPNDALTDSLEVNVGTTEIHDPFSLYKS